MKLVITGGHRSSAIPIIKKLQKDYPNIQISWIGHRHSSKTDKNDTLEFKEITALGLPFYVLQAGKVYRNLNSVRLLQVPLGFVHAFILLRHLKPDLILSFGGYLAAPVVVSGWCLNIPSITHEQTLVAGYANRFISLFADKILLSWQESAKYFSSKKIKYVGLPLRESIFKATSNIFVTDNNLPYIYITAGKSGSIVINNLVSGCLDKLLTICNVIMQCGDHSEFDSLTKISTQYAQIKTTVPGKLFLRKFVLEDEIGEAFTKASLVFCRAGAHTISELLALNTPALLMPIPWVSHNEQYINASLLVKIGLGQIIDQKTSTPETVFAKIQEMLANIHTYKKTVAVSLVSNPTELIVDEILKYAKKS